MNPSPLQAVARTHGNSHGNPWLPAHPHVEAWVGRLAAQVEAQGKPQWRPVIEEFRELIDRDPVVRLYITSMITQVPNTKPYRVNHLRSVDQMLSLINAVLTQAPEYNTTELVGAPLNAIIDWSMGTPAGFAAFRHPPINQMFKKILNVWCQYLSSEASLYVLNDSPTGWTSPAAQKAMSIEDYDYNPKDRHWGFRSWNDFFTRRFKPGKRPVADPGNSKIIVNACESTPYRIALGAKRQDRFWLKAQPYSLQDMLANDEAVEQFVGGTIYQAFLSALNYHRWHSPVSGTVRRAYVQEGTYYSEADAEGEDPAGPNNSQGYITQVATRALIFIEADDPAIGLLCLMPVGMAEISSCIIGPDIRPGCRVNKGDELGYFQYGGSTHCLILRPGVVADFAAGVIPQPDNPQAPAMLLSSRLATAT